MRRLVLVEVDAADRAAERALVSAVMRALTAGFDRVPGLRVISVSQGTEERLKGEIDDFKRRSPALRPEDV